MRAGPVFFPCCAEHERWKTDRKEAVKSQKERKARADNGMTAEQLKEMQQKLFDEARAQTLGLLPHAQAANPAAAAAAVVEPQELQSQAPLPAHVAGPLVIEQAAVLVEQGIVDHGESLDDQGVAEDPAAGPQGTSL